MGRCRTQARDDHGVGDDGREKQVNGISLATSVGKIVASTRPPHIPSRWSLSASWTKVTNNVMLRENNDKAHVFRRVLLHDGREAYPRILWQ
jgi:hypothetical protein